MLSLWKSAVRYLELYSLNDFLHCNDIFSFDWDYVILVSLSDQ